LITHAQIYGRYTAIFITYICIEIEDSNLAQLRRTEGRVTPIPLSYLIAEQLI